MSLLTMEDIVSDLRVEIVKSIRGPDVLQRLLPHIVSHEDGSAIKHLYDKNNERANHRLLDALFLSREPGKWAAFLQALKDADYTYLAKLLKSGESPPAYRHQKMVLEAFTTVLEGQINPRELLGSLLAFGTINNTDVEEILAKQDSHGIIPAAVVLLDRIQCRLDPVDWYRQFLQALLENKRQDLVELVDPDFMQSQDFKKSTNDPQLNLAQCSTVDDVTAQAGSDRELTERLKHNKNIMVNIMNVAEVVHHFDCSVLNRGQRSDFTKLAQDNPVEAASRLVDFTITNRAERELLRALQSSGFIFLANILLDQTQTDSLGYFRNLIQVLGPSLHERISTINILDPLQQHGVIGAQDIETIEKARETQGETAAVRALLDCIPRKLEPKQWYIKFLQVLAANQLEDVVHLIEPDFLRNPEVFREKFSMQVANRLEHLTDLPQCYDDLIAYDLELIAWKEKALLKSKEQILATLQKERNRIANEMDEHVDQLTTQVETIHSEFLQRLALSREKLTGNKYQHEGNDHPGDQRHDDAEIPTIVWPSIQLTGRHRLVKAVHCERTTELKGIKMYGGGIMDANSSGHLVVSNQRAQLSTDSYCPSNQSDEERFWNATNISICHLSGRDGEDQLELKTNWIFSRQACRISDNVILQSLSRYDFTSFVVLSDGRIAGFVEEANAIVVCDINSCAMAFIPYTETIGVLKLLRNDKLVGMPIESDSEMFPVFSLGTRNTTVLHQWSCEHARCAIATYNDVAYVLCEGKEIHLFCILENQPAETWIILKGLSLSTWKPAHAEFGDDGTRLYVSDEVSQEMYCFNTKSGDMLLQYDIACSSPNFAISGLYFYNSAVYVYDAEDTSLKKLSADGKVNGMLTCKEFKRSSLIVFDTRNGNVLVSNYTALPSDSDLGRWHVEELLDNLSSDSVSVMSNMS